MKKYLITTRDYEDYLRLKHLLVEISIQSYNFPLITYEIFNNNVSINSYDYLILTSSKPLKLPELEFKGKVLTIGNSLFEKCKQKFGELNVINTGSNVDDLINYITNNNQLQNKKIFYLRGEEITADLKQKFPEFNITEQIVYRGNEIDKLDANFKELLYNTNDLIITLFSQNNARVLSKLLLQEKDKIKANITFICLSEKIAKELLKLGNKNIIFCEKPNINLMIEKIKQVI